MQNLQVARALFTSPTGAFTLLKDKPAFALPMWLTLLGTIAVTAWYYSKVDIAWLQHQMVTVTTTGRMTTSIHSRGARNGIISTIAVRAGNVATWKTK